MCLSENFDVLWDILEGASGALLKIVATSMLSLRRANLFNTFRVTANVTHIKPQLLALQKCANFQRNGGHSKW